LIRLLKLLIRDNEAASAVEYAVLIALIAAVIVFSVQRIGNTVNNVFANVGSAIENAAPKGSCCD